RRPRPIRPSPDPSGPVPRPVRPSPRSPPVPSDDHLVGALTPVGLDLPQMQLTGLVTPGHVGAGLEWRCHSLGVLVVHPPVSRLEVGCHQYGFSDAISAAGSATASRPTRPRPRRRRHAGQSTTTPT